MPRLEYFSGYLMRNHTFETEEFVLSDALRIYKLKNALSPLVVVGDTGMTSHRSSTNSSRSAGRAGSERFVCQQAQLSKRWLVSASSD
jgi:hypothetical protein